MYWYTIFRQGDMPGTGIHGPYSSEDKAWIKLYEIQEEDPTITPWDVHSTYISDPKEALLEFLAERKSGYVGGRASG